MDNIASLMCAAASQQADLPERSRKCNRSYAAGLMPRLLPRLLLLIDDVCAAITDAIGQLGATSQRFVPQRSRPRPPHHVKPHPSCAYKG